MLYLKLIDVEPVQSGIDTTVKDIEDFYDQVGTVQRAVRDFHSLDEALGGEGGEAIRAFYRDCHEPFLVMLHQSMIDYKKVLTEMGEAIDSFEPGESGYISQEFIEGEVIEALDKVKDTTIKYTEEANSIIDEVSDLVKVPEIDESDLVEFVQKGRSKNDELVDDLHQLDSAQVSAIESVKEDLHTMEDYISELEQLFNDGDFSIEDYSLDAMRKIDAFRAVTESVYGEDGIIGIILKKMSNGEPLTDLERENLYEYFQNEVLDDKKREEIEDIVDLLNGENIDKLTERLNDKVVISDEALMEEMEMIEAYLYLGNNMPKETEVDYFDRGKLEAYSVLLKDFYHHMIDESNVMEVKDMQFKRNPEGVPGYFISAEMALNEYDPDDGIHEIKGLKDKNDYRNFALYNPDYRLIPEYVTTEITFAEGRGAGVNIRESDLENLKKEKADYQTNFVITESLKKVVAGLAKRVDVSDWAEALSILAGNAAGSKELDEKIDTETALLGAEKLNLEISIREDHNGELTYQLYPLDATFEKIERWKELHEDHPEIPFPQDAINSGDWYKVGETLSKMQKQFGTELTDHIQDGEGKFEGEVRERHFKYQKK